MMKTLLFFIASALTLGLYAQPSNGKLKFVQGQEIRIRMELKTTVAQQAMGQAIDFDVKANALHSYKVTNATDDNTTLHHELKNINFQFDGMGFKRNFNSENEKDMSGNFGKPVKELLGKSFDMVIDPAGKVLLVKPDSVSMPAMDDRLAIIGNMLKDVFDLVHPPQKSGPSFFSVLPPGELKVGKTWTDQYENANGKFEMNYELAELKDSTIVIKMSGKSLTVSTAEFMGNLTHTTMNNKTTGTIILDGFTGIIREKSTLTESNGTTELMGSSVPVTSKTSIVLRVE